MKALVVSLWVAVCLSSVAVSAPPSSNPFILVHGFGPVSLVGMQKYAKFLKSDGVPEEDIHVLDYPQLERPEKIVEAFKASLESVFAKYPPQTRFNFIGHSYGGFVSLYATLEAGYFYRMAQYVSLAGIARGQNQTSLCGLLPCGSTLTLLHPFMSPFVQTYLSKFALELERLPKCALYSPADKIVRAPENSGALPGSLSIRVLEAGHMEFIHSQDLYDLMKTTCFGAPAPKDGFLHEWSVDQGIYLLR